MKAMMLEFCIHTSLIALKVLPQDFLLVDFSHRVSFDEIDNFEDGRNFVGSHLFL